MASTMSSESINSDSSKNANISTLTFHQLNVPKHINVYFRNPKGSAST
jgi:hypothetical protein